MNFLSCRNLAMRFGGLSAVSDFNLELKDGEIVGLIGPNGAGKTTVFNMIAGYYVPTEGTISLHGERVNGLKASQINKRGIARTFQNIRLFSELTVLENIVIANHGRMKSTFIEALFRLPRYRREESIVMENASVLLDAVGLSGLAQDRSGSLPYGVQRRVEIARALATEPSLLLLDEPAAGMNPSETQDLLGLLFRLRENYGLTLLVIEHDMKFVMRLCDRIKVLDYGVTISEGTPGEVQNDPRVIEAYLGEV